uniref:Uncharacterized protein n=1 Tax=Nymphaea colorata TaxID=210225 RepID=A0A5K1DRW4_9MAGN
MEEAEQGAALNSAAAAANCLLFSRSFINVALNIARVSQCMYDYEDGIGVLEHESMDCVYSLIVEPI